MKTFRPFTHAFLLAALALCSVAVSAQEAAIRRNLSERYPSLPKVDEVSKTPVNGIYEIRLGNEVVYTDAKADFLFQGSFIDTRTQQNLTELRKQKLLDIEFTSLPLNNSFQRIQGNGKRKLVVFVDPNCGYCKRFEKSLQELDNVTIYFMLYPVLGDDSYNKSYHVWCAKDKDAVWTDWMISGVVPPSASCNTDAIAQNVAFGQKNRINGTPTMFLGNGRRITGAVAIPQLDKMMNEVQ